MLKFRKKQFRFIIVTDLAARGIDIPLLENVVHYDFPTTMKLFIHRSGRTARAGKDGKSYGILTTDELPYLHDLSVYVGRKISDTSDIDDPKIINYGTLPQTTIDEYTAYSQNLVLKFPSVIKPL